MSKLSLEKNYVYVEHCNYNFYTPYLRTTISVNNFTKYNVVNLTDNVVNGLDNVIYIGI